MNYNDAMTTNDDDIWNNDMSDIDTDFSGENDEEDDDFDENKEGGQRRRGKGQKDRPLPPLLARVNGQIEVLHHYLLYIAPTSIHKR